MLKSHKTFSSDEEFHTADEEDTKIEEEEYQSSDDEAPEEEDFLNDKTKIEQLEKQQKRIEIKNKQELKSIRREQNSKFEKQKESKKSKEVPDLLPKELLENLETTSTYSLPVNKKIKFDDEEDDTKLIDQQLKSAKFKLVNQLNKKQKTIGKINVKLLNAKKKNLPPPAIKGQTGIKKVRDKWMKRSSLNKKIGY